MVHGGCMLMLEVIEYFIASYRLLKLYKNTQNKQIKNYQMSFTILYIWILKKINSVQVIFVILLLSLSLLVCSPRKEEHGSYHSSRNIVLFLYQRLLHIPGYVYR